MTRGQDGSLRLSCVTLSFTTPRRFYPGALSILLRGKTRKLPLRPYPGQSPIYTIVFIPLSAAQSKLNADWAEASAEVIIRRCPVCSQDSIIGHGRRQKQAHDEHHDWITIRRGLCRPCHLTITFLPGVSLPYTHYSLIARSEALRRYFVEGYSWEAAAPPVKDPHHVADSSTLRRWLQVLDSSQPRSEER